MQQPKKEKKFISQNNKLDMITELELQLNQRSVDLKKKLIFNSSKKRPKTQEKINLRALRVVFPSLLFIFWKN